MYPAGAFGNFKNFGFRLVQHLFDVSALRVVSVPSNLCASLCQLTHDGSAAYDFGIAVTRTVFYKEVSEENRNIYEIVRKAQIAGIKAVKPGIPMKEIDAVTRGVIEAAGYGEYFITRTGHGVGLSIHEEPMCSPDSEEICREGMCFSIEPGIYIPGKTGVRIEDLVIVTGDGCKVLTHYPKDLQIIK